MIIPCQKGLLLVVSALRLSAEFIGPFSLQRRDER